VTVGQSSELIGGWLAFKGAHIQMAMIRDWLVTRRKSSKLAGYELGMDCSTKKGAQMPDREQLIRKILH
jgi:hypothetical protein